MTIRFQLSLPPVIFCYAEPCIEINKLWLKIAFTPSDQHHGIDETQLKYLQLDGTNGRKPTLCQEKWKTEELGHSLPFTDRSESQVLSKV